MSDQNDELAEIIDDFVIESREHLADVESELLEIEKGGAEINSDLVNTVFRAVHSVKGAADFLGFANLARLAHQLENVLNRVRNRDLVPTPDNVDVLLRGADEVRTMLNDVHNSNDVDCSSIVAELESILDGDDVSGTADHPPVDIPTGQSTPQGEPVSFHLSSYDLKVHAGSGAKLYQIKLDLYRDYAARERSLMDLPKDLTDLGEILDSYSEFDFCESFDQFKAGCPAPLTVLLASQLSLEQIAACWDLAPDSIATVPYPEATPETNPEATPGTPVPAPTAAIGLPNESPVKNQPPPSSDSGTPRTNAETTDADTSIRVSVHLLDHLMTLAGELVLGRNQLLQSMTTQDQKMLLKVGTRIDQVTTEMQEAIMETRMQPIAGVFNRFTRVVRDLTKKLGKSATLFIEGGDVELDRTIIEGLSDPLTHLIRNSIDHGIETPEIREAQGKPAQGSVWLRAFHKNGKVHISVSDDGAGIDSSRLREKAVSSGIMSEADARNLSENDALRLLFLPGLSTAKEVTAVSGRGVGMDVVKTNFENLGGVVEIETEPGAGSTFHIKLPLTLAILASLIVENDGERYAIPQVSIAELVRIKADEITDRIYEVNGERLLRLRGDLLPIVDLCTVLGLAGQELGVTKREAERTIQVIVVDTGQLRYGIRVDKMLDSEEIVLKPLGQHLQQCRELAGMTIVGDGRVALILDVAGIAESQRLTAVDEATAAADQLKTAELGERVDSYILFENGPSEYFAVTMRLVSRLDRIQPDAINEVGGLDLYYCGGKALPLIKLPNVINAKPVPELDRYYALVFVVGDEEIALLVPKLIDVQQLAVEIDHTTFQEAGIAGSFILEDKMVRLLDLNALGLNALGLDALGHGSAPAAPAPATPPPAADAGDSSQGQRVILAEDSGFFRDQIAMHLRDLGLDVIECVDGAEAWQSLQAATAPVDLVVTDMEMPNLNGFELAKTIRSYPEYRSIPILALTSLSNDADLERAKEAGIDEYHVKLNRDEFVATVNSLLAGVAANA